MTRKISLILALALAAIVPPAAHAYLPQGFIGVSPQSPANSADFELMREAGVESVRLPLYWSQVQPKAADRRRAGLVGLRPRGRARRRSRNPGHALRLGLAGMGGAAADRPAGAELLAALGLDQASCAKRPSATGPTARSGKSNPDLPFLPIHRWEIWNEENIVTFADVPTRPTSRS